MIRRMEEAELPLCLEVIHRSFATVAEEFGLTAENCPTNGAFMSLERLVGDFHKADEMYVACENTQIVGFMALAPQGDSCEMEKLAVAPAFRHKGYGAQLVSFAFARSRELGAQRMTIGIIEENARLKAWYEKHGFVSTGTRVFAHLPFTVGFMSAPVI